MTKHLKHVRSIVLSAVVIGSAIATAAAQTPAPDRFSIIENGAAIKDGQTGLIWKRCQEGKQWENNRCTGKAERFEFYQTPKNKGTWRLPTDAELKTLPLNDKGVLDEKLFPDSEPDIEEVRIEEIPADNLKFNDVTSRLNPPNAKLYDTGVNSRKRYFAWRLVQKSQ